MLDEEGRFGDMVGGSKGLWVGYNRPVLEALIFLLVYAVCCRASTLPAGT